MNHSFIHKRTRDYYLHANTAAADALREDVAAAKCLHAGEAHLGRSCYLPWGTSCNSPSGC